MSEESYNKAWSKIIAKAWSDSAFKNRLMGDPKAVFAEYGVEFPSGTAVQMHENDTATSHMVFPQKPEGELSEENLEAIGAEHVNGCTSGSEAVPVA